MSKHKKNLWCILFHGKWRKKWFNIWGGCLDRCDECLGYKDCISED